MADRPMLFSGPMVRAILEGRKTQTRRVVKPSCGAVVDTGVYHWPFKSDGHFSHAVDCPYGKRGDRLWVREAWRSLNRFNGCAVDPSSMIAYEADANTGDLLPCQAASGGKTFGRMGKLRPSIHMPRWASRITLEITGVRVERLQDISEADARLEGVEWSASEDGYARFAFHRLWESINGAGSWSANPWVWVVEFRRV